MVQKESSEIILEQRWAPVAQFYQSVFESDLTRLANRNIEPILPKWWKDSQDVIFNQDLERYESAENRRQWENDYFALSLCVSIVASKSLSFLKQAGFQVIDSKGGFIIVHQDFLDIQDRWGELEKDEKAKKLHWTSQKALKALEKQLVLKKLHRERHECILNDAIDLLSPEEKGWVQKTMAKLPARFSFNTGVNNLVLVALPSIYDKPKLYKRLCGNETLYKSILSSFHGVPWMKIDESGVVFASAKYRDDCFNIDEAGVPRGHDFFSYAARGKQNIKGMMIASDETGRHEGDHWKLDVWLNMLMNTAETCNWTTEGLINALRKKSFSKDIIDYYYLFNPECMHFAFLGPQERADLKHNLIYNSGPFAWNCIIKLVQEKTGRGESLAWIYVFKALLQAGLKIRLRACLYNQYGLESLMFTSVLDLLGITKEEFEHEYLTSA